MLKQHGIVCTAGGSEGCWLAPQVSGHTLSLPLALNML